LQHEKRAQKTRRYKIVLQRAQRINQSPFNQLTDFFRLPYPTACATLPPERQLRERNRQRCHERTGECTYYLLVIVGTGVFLGCVLVWEQIYGIEQVFEPLWNAYRIYRSGILVESATSKSRSDPPRNIQLLADGVALGGYHI